jgi:hypothetical protein
LREQKQVVMVENKVDRDVPLDLEWRGEKVFSL